MVTVPAAGDVRLHVFTGCPRCADMDILINGDMSLCRECGYAWVTEEAE